MRIPLYLLWLSNFSITNFNAVIFTNTILNSDDVVRENNLQEDVNYYFASPTICRIVYI